MPGVTPKELRSRRIALGLTVPELAHELDLTTQELQQMEDGVRAMPPHEPFLTLFESTTVRVKKERWRDCLVVEDDEAVRQLFAARLRAEGLTVDEAEDGLAAVDATVRRDYRLMLLDLKLPKLSGAEVLARVAKKATQPANVIVISGADSGDVRTVANNRAVNAILRKGFAITNADVIFPALAALARA
jgi:CheY-like chemotaxis protein/DNA-binding XRE family transcriptional regulator